MRISIAGCGYVGCVTWVCFADMDKVVSLVDHDRLLGGSYGDDARIPANGRGLRNLFSGGEEIVNLGIRKGLV